MQSLSPKQNMSFFLFLSFLLFHSFSLSFSLSFFPSFFPSFCLSFFLSLFLSTALSSPFWLRVRVRVSLDIPISSSVFFQFVSSEFFFHSPPLLLHSVHTYFLPWLSVCRRGRHGYDGADETVVVWRRHMMHARCTWGRLKWIREPLGGPDDIMGCPWEGGVGVRRRHFWGSWRV